MWGFWLLDLLGGFIGVGWVLDSSRIECRRVDIARAMAILSAV